MQDRIAVDLDARIAHRQAQCQRARAPLALLRLQLQGLDDWRERLGRGMVDSLCNELGERLRRRVRDTDEVVVQGDGRYAVLLPGATSVDAGVVELRLQLALGAPYRIGPLLLSPHLLIERTHWPAEAQGFTRPERAPRAAAQAVAVPLR